MACDTRIPAGSTPAQRKKDVTDAVKKLEAALSAGTVTVKVGPTGGLTFAGWSDRNGVSDGCAFRKLTASSSWALRQAVARAEAMAGRKVDPKQVAAGVHSHDGGASWHEGH